MDWLLVLLVVSVFAGLVILSLKLQQQEKQPIIDRPLPAKEQFSISPKDVSKFEISSKTKRNCPGWRIWRRVLSVPLENRKRRRSAAAKK